MKAIRKGNVIPTKSLPFRRVYALAYILFCNVTTEWVSLTFLPFTILEFYPSTEFHTIGAQYWMYYSSLACGHLISTLVWSHLSVRLGRRLSIMFCLLGMTFAICLLGFSPNFYISVIAQFILGLFHEISGIIRSYTIRTTDDGLTSNGIVSGFGLCTGILIGGFGAFPMEFFPILENTIFSKFPFALPCLIISIFNILAAILSYFELNDSKTIRKTSMLSGINSSTEYVHLQTDDDDVEDLISTNGKSSDKQRRRLTEILTEAEISEHEMDDSETPKGMMSENGINGLQAQIARASGSNVNNISDKSHNNNELSKRVSFNSLVEVRVIGSPSQAYSKLKYVHPEDTPLEGGAVSRYTNGSEFFASDGMVESPSEAVRRLLLKENVFLIICLHAFMHCLSATSMNVLVLWLITERTFGGLAFDTRQTALFIALSMSLALLYQITRFADVIKDFGLIRVYRNSALMVMAASWILTSPTVLDIKMKERVLMVVCMVFYVVLAIGLLCGCSSARVLLVNSAYCHQQITVMKIADFVQSILYAISACVACNLYAWSSLEKRSWPLNFPLVWYAIGLLSIYNYRLASRLPKNMNRCRREPAEPRYAVTMIKSKLEDYGDGGMDTLMDVSLNGTDEMSRLVKR